MSQREIVVYWLEKAEQDLASAKENLAAGRLQNSVRDAYFACLFLLGSADKGWKDIQEAQRG
jgi:uncharacterized protein (UPF0332 family)